jgi:hypothetical protein
MWRNRNRVIALSFTVGFLVLVSSTCAPAPEVKKESVPEVEPSIPIKPGFMMKPYHHSMLEEMQKSYQRADEIIIGVYTGSYMDEQRVRKFYFENFRRFDRDSLTWSPVENILLPISFQGIKPELISQQEYKNLSELDRTGICWDYYDQTRYLYLVEGVETLVFLERTVDDIQNTSYRILIDTYPSTKNCNAKAVFDLMVKNMVKMDPYFKGGLLSWD